MDRFQFRSGPSVAFTARHLWAPPSVSVTCSISTAAHPFPECLCVVSAWLVWVIHALISHAWASMPPLSSELLKDRVSNTFFVSSQSITHRHRIHELLLCGVCQRGEVQAHTSSFMLHQELKQSLAHLFSVNQIVSLNSLSGGYLLDFMLWGEVPFLVTLC